MSHANPNILASHGQPCNEADTSQPSTNASKDHLDISQNGDAHGDYDSVKSLLTAYVLHHNHEDKVPYRPLTTQVLYEDNIQRGQMSRMLGSQDLSRYGNVTMFEADVVPPESIMHGPHNEGTGGFNDNLPNSPFQTQNQQHSTASMYNEADCNTPNYQSAALLQSRSVCHDNTIDMPGSDMFDADPLSWDFDQDHDITAWGNALAGVGEHLVDHAYQEYINRDKLVVD